jgi:hypothetical protein
MSGMRDIDREVLERLEKDGNVLGWKPHSRDAEGNAVLHCTPPGLRERQDRRALAAW